MEWEKVFANDATDKGSVSKIYKRSYSSITNKQTNKKPTQSKKWQTLIDIPPKKAYSWLVDT